MSTVRTVNGVLRRYDLAPHRIRDYFKHAPTLVRDYPLEVCLSYMFSQVEVAHNMTLYCGAVKLHKADSNLTWEAIRRQHITREGFQRLFEEIYGARIPAASLTPLSAAEKVRDQVMHGKRPSEADKRAAVANVIEYAEKLNEYLSSKAGLRPFGVLRGFKGRAKPLDKKTTRWILKGIGFDLS